MRAQTGLIGLIGLMGDATVWFAGDLAASAQNDHSDDLTK
jgi:hypothetical protein